MQCLDANDTHGDEVADPAGQLRQFGLPPSDVSFVVVAIDIINVVISTNLPTGRASPPPHSLAATIAAW